MRRAEGCNRAGGRGYWRGSNDDPRKVGTAPRRLRARHVVQHQRRALVGPAVLATARACASTALSPSPDDSARAGVVFRMHRWRPAHPDDDESIVSMSLALYAP